MLKLARKPYMAPASIGAIEVCGENRLASLLPIHSTKCIVAFTGPICWNAEFETFLVTPTPYVHSSHNAWFIANSQAAFIMYISRSRCVVSSVTVSHEYMQVRLLLCARMHSLWRTRVGRLVDWRGFTSCV